MIFISFVLGIVVIIMSFIVFIVYRDIPKKITEYDGKLPVLGFKSEKSLFTIYLLLTFVFILFSSLTVYDFSVKHEIYIKTDYFINKRDKTLTKVVRKCKKMWYDPDLCEIKDSVVLKIMEVNDGDFYLRRI